MKNLFNNLIKVAVIGNSRPIEELMQFFDKLKNYDMIFKGDSIGEYKSSVKEEPELVIVPSKDFYGTNAKFWDFIAERFINREVTVKTDYEFYEEIFQRLSDEAIEDKFYILRKVAGKQPSR
jgi:hypothetical protein